VAQALRSPTRASRGGVEVLLPVVLFCEEDKQRRGGGLPIARTPSASLDRGNDDKKTGNFFLDIRC